MARRATKIQELRESTQNLLVLDAGDSLIGDQDPAMATAGASSVEILNLMGYDAVALGPRDLALGVPALRSRIAEAHFPLLSANAFASPTGDLLAQPYVLREMSGHRLAIVGVSGHVDTPGIDVRDPLFTVASLVQQLRGQADIIILLSHAGTEIDQQIADSVPGIALIVSGERPALSEPWISPITGAMLVRADAATPGHAGRVIGIGHFTFEPTGRLSDHVWQRTPLEPEVADDPAIQQWVEAHFG